MAGACGGTCSTQRGGGNSVKEGPRWVLVTAHVRSLLLEEEAGEEGLSCSGPGAGPGGSAPTGAGEAFWGSGPHDRSEERAASASCSVFSVVSVVALSVSPQCLLSAPSQMTE